MNWQELATASHYQTAVAVRQKLLEKDMEEVDLGMEELIESLGRADKRALRSQLIRLMAHIIKWKTQPDQRSRSGAGTIENARIEIEELLEFEPSLKPSVSDLLKELFVKAKRLAETEITKKVSLRSLSWEEVLNDEYNL
ncbi:MAG: DUF29 domain-containing protein [bacterium]|nr:DUF29 domain-containing protein [bacterium]